MKSGTRERETETVFFCDRGQIMKEHDKEVNYTFYLHIRMVINMISTKSTQYTCMVGDMVLISEHIAHV